MFGSEVEIARLAEVGYGVFVKKKKLISNNELLYSWVVCFIALSTIIQLNLPIGKTCYEGTILKSEQVFELIMLSFDLCIAPDSLS